MNESKTDTKQLANRLGVPQTTLRSWVEKLDIPVERSKTKMRFGEQAISIVETVKQLREQERGFATIRKRLQNERLAVLQLEETVAQPLRHDLQQLLNESIEKSLARNNEIAEKYARATYTIGQLEERLKFMEGQNQELERKVALLEGKQNRSWLAALKLWFTALR